MRKVFLLITFILIHISVYATESTDSAATTLGEVVVKGKRQYAIDGGVVYIPTRNEKKAARNAQDLLRHIGITQIDVDPQSFSVKTLAGKDVQIFVNGVKSDPESVWTMEVKRVEYLVAPPDPKFLGAQYVINYIVEKYRYGGYTRLSLQEAFLAGLDSRAGIFSRFAYRSMTFDLYASAANSAAAKHRGSSTEETYSLTGDGGAPFLAERRESLSGRKGRADRYPLTFSAMYSGARCSARNSVSFNFAERKDHREDGTVSLWPLLPESGESSRLSDSRGRSVSWYGDAFLWTDNGWHFGYNGSFAYDRNDGSTLYSSPYAGGILTISKEDVFDYRLHLMANKSLGAHRIGLHLSGSNTNNRVVYSGTSPAKNSFSSPALSARFSYGLNISRFNLSFDVAPGWERSKVNNTVNSFFTLVSHLQASFTPDSRNQFSLWAQAAKSGNSPADNSEAVIRLNDLMYVSGNPHLKAPLHFDMNLSYSWIPSDMFTMTAYGSLATVGDRITADFRRHDDGAALLRTLVNSGRFTSAEIGVSLRLTLFGRRLRLSATPVQKFYKSTGLNAMTYSPFAVKANAYWYQGPFWAGLHYQNGDRSIDPPERIQDEGTRLLPDFGRLGQRQLERLRRGVQHLQQGLEGVRLRAFRRAIHLPPDHIRRQPACVSLCRCDIHVRIREKDRPAQRGEGERRRAVRRLRPIGPGRDPTKLNPDTGEIHWYEEKIRYLDNDTTPKRCRKCKMLPDCTGPCRRHVAEGEGDECFLDDLKMSIEDYALMQFRIELVKCA